MRFPSIKRFKKAMRGGKGFVVYLCNPKGEKMREMIVEGPLTDEQYERFDKFVIDLLNENAARHKAGDPVSYTSTER